MGLLEFLKIKKHQKEKSTTERLREYVLSMPLRIRARAAYEGQDSFMWGGGKINFASYASGIEAALVRCCRVFGIKLDDVVFRHIEGRWYQVEIEDIVLLTENYHEYFGMFYWLIGSCPYCGQLAKGAKMISSLYDLGEAIKHFEAGEKHLEKCPSWRVACNRPGFASNFEAEVTDRGIYH